MKKQILFIILTAILFSLNIFSNSDLKLLKMKEDPKKGKNILFMHFGDLQELSVKLRQNPVRWRHLSCVPNIAEGHLVH